MKKRLLFLLMVAAILTSAATVFITAYAFKAQEQALDAMMRSYVLDLANSIATTLWDGGCSMDHAASRTCLNCIHTRMTDLHILSVVSGAHGRRPGGVLVLTEEGEAIAASPGAKELLSLPWRGLSPDEPTEVRDAEGNRYHVVMKGPRNDNYLLVAVSRAYLLGPVINVRRFWTTSALLMSAAVLALVLTLWRWLAVPLRRVVESMHNIKWGRDRPTMPKPLRLFEIEALSGAIEELADKAVEREELRARYVSDMVRVQEDSRRQLARELHDGPLQGVVAAIKRIQLAQDPLSPRSAENLKTAENIAQNAAREVREYCDRLSPSWVKLGVAGAILENADHLAQAFEIKVEMLGLEESEALPDLPEERVLALVRILQEAVSNSARHGGASRVEVLLEKQDEKNLRFRIRDNGTGFLAPDPSDDALYENLLATRHRGLANIRERVRLLHGTMRLESEPGRGCLIDIYFPFAPDSESESGIGPYGNR